MLVQALPPQLCTPDQAPVSDPALALCMLDQAHALALALALHVGGIPHIQPYHLAFRTWKFGSEGAVEALIATVSLPTKFPDP